MPINIDDILYNHIVFNLPNNPIKKVEKTIGIVWGGIDVDPSTYNKEKSVNCGGTSKKLDDEELDFIMQCWNQEAPVIGICRGAQLLNCANDGILIQHIENHTNIHTVETHLGTKIPVTSTHHQAIVPTKEAVIFARANFPCEGNHWDNVNDWYKYKHVNEIVYYPSTRSLCIQPHPEYVPNTDEMNVYLDVLTKDLFNVKVDWHKSYSAHQQKGKDYGFCYFRK